MSSQAVLPRIGSTIEQDGTFYIVIRHPTHNLDTLSGMVMARRVLNVNTMETTKRATRIWIAA